MILPPRAHYLTEPLSIDEQRPFLFDPQIVDSLPVELQALTGAIRSARLLKHDGCFLPLFLDAEQGTFALKVAKGSYRSQELWAEHTAMQILRDGPIPVPHPMAYMQQGDLSFQLREYCTGTPLSAVLSADESIRPDAIRQLGELLARIHATSLAGGWTWDDWISASLEEATRNLAAGVHDPDEFTLDEPPNATLDWLLANRPAAGSICLLHGDYRPKNVMWQNGRIVGVIDWAYVDIGDPYYDLSVIHWYMRDEAEWQQFLHAYGLGEFDQERFEYCMALQKFLNV